MIVSFVYPSSAQYTGGVVALYEFANALARRGNRVQFLHGPATPHRIHDIAELDWFAFDPSIEHHLFDSIDDPSIPVADVVNVPGLPARIGLPFGFVQGHGMMAPEWERQAFRAPGPKVCIARWLVDIGATYGAPAEQLLHVPYGLDHDVFRVVTPLDQRPVDVALLYNSHPAKGWATAVESLELVRRHRPDLRVEVFGVLPPEIAIPEWMHFTRGLDREWLAREAYNQARVFLQPSWFEGFGFTAVEAMASGCALVSTDNGGSQDYAIHDETALVAAPGDAAALGEHVAALLDDPGLRSRLATAGTRYVQRFDWDRSGELLDTHLRRYLADPASFQVPPGPEQPAPAPAAARS